MLLVYSLQRVQASNTVVSSLSIQDTNQMQPLEEHIGLISNSSGRLEKSSCLQLKQWGSKAETGMRGLKANKFLGKF